MVKSCSSNRSRRRLPRSWLRPGHGADDVHQIHRDHDVDVHHERVLFRVCANAEPRRDSIFTDRPVRRSVLDRKVFPATRRQSGVGAFGTVVLGPGLRRGHAHDDDKSRADDNERSQLSRATTRPGGWLRPIASARPSSRSKRSGSQCGDYVTDDRNWFSFWKPIRVVARSHLREARQSIGHSFNQSKPGSRNAH